MLVNPEVLGPEYNRLYPQPQREIVRPKRSLGDVPLLQAMRNIPPPLLNRRTVAVKCPKRGLRDLLPLPPPLKRGRGSGSETEADEPQLALSGPGRLLEDPDDDLPIALLGTSRTDPLNESSLSRADQKTIRVFRSLVRSREYRAAEDILEWDENSRKIDFVRRELVKYYVDEKNFAKAQSMIFDVSNTDIRQSCIYLIEQAQKT